MFILLYASMYTVANGLVHAFYYKNNNYLITHVKISYIFTSLPAFKYIYTGDLRVCNNVLMPI